MDSSSILTNDDCDSNDDDSHVTNIFEAVRIGDEYKVNIFIDEKNEKQDGSTPLHLAVKMNREDMILMLLENGADPTIADDDGNTPLHLAISNKRLDATKILIAHTNWDFSSKNKKRESLLKMVQIKSRRYPKWQDVKEMIDIQSSKTFQNAPRKVPDLKENQLSNKSHQASSGESETKKPKLQIPQKVSTYASSGLKTSLHGTIYQLQLLMLFVHRARKLDYVNFDVATEFDLAEKFDDVVIKYKRPMATTWTWRFLQAKHKQEIDKHKITVNELTTTSDKGEFSLQKYFVSFCKIKANPEFRAATLEEFDLCTNTSFDFTERNKRKRDGTLRADAIDHNEKVNKWKTFFTQVDISTDEMLYFKDDHEMTKNKLDISKKVDLLKFMKQIFLDKILTSKDFKQLTNINRYLNTIRCLEAQPKIEQIVNDVTNKIVSAKKPTKILFESVSKQLIKLKGKILDDKSYAIFEKFTDKSTQKPSLQDVDDERKKICNDIETTLKIEEYKLVDYRTINSQAAKDLNEEYKQLKDTLRKVEQFLEELPNFTLPMDADIDKAGLTSLLKKKLDNLKKSNSNIDEVKESLREELQLYISNTVMLHLLLADQTFQQRIEEFIEAFCIITNYPNVDQINDYLSTELGEQFQLLNADLVSHSFQKDMLDWLKQYDKGSSEYLSNDKGNLFFNSIHEKIRTLMVSGLNKAYPDKLKTYGIHFNSKLVFLDTFLNSNDKKLLHLYTHSTRLVAINVLQTLHGDNRFMAHDSFIFLRIRTILRTEIRDLLIESFKSEHSHHLLIIESKLKHNYERNVLNNLLNELNSILEHSTNVPKRIIIISNNGNLLNERFEKLSYYQKQMVQLNFEALTEISQKKVLEKICTFQENKIALKRLMNHRTAQKILDPNILTQIIEDKTIEIGNDEAFFFNDYIQEYYIERNLHLQTIDVSVFKEIDRNLFFVTGIDGNELVNMGANINFVNEYDMNEKYDNGIVWYKGDESDQETMYKKICICSIKMDTHWLDYKYNHLFWKKSKGDFSTISDYVVTKYVCTENYFHEDHFSVPNNVKEKIIIIANDTGVGKSTFLTGLSRKLIKNSSSTWIIRINLNDFAFNKNKLSEKDSRHKMKSLREITFKENGIASAIDFFTEMATTGDYNGDSVQKRLLKFSLEVTERDYLVPKIIILFDGFDEISPTYSQQVIVLLKALKQSNVTQIYITTRLHEKNLLEGAMQTPALLLKSFEKDDQIRFLDKFWRYSLKFFKEEDNHQLYKKMHEYLTDITPILDETEINETIDNISITPLPANEVLRGYVNHIQFSNFADDLLYQWQNKIIDNDTAFNIVPLHLRMLAEIIFYDKFKITEDFNLLKLYNKFVEIKYNIFYDEKKNLGNTVGAEEIRDFHSGGLRELLHKISLHVLFPDNYKDEIDDNLKVHLARIGLLILKGERRLDFIHRSFAGFFLTEFVVLHFCEEKTQTLLFKTVLLEEAYNFVREFFNNQLQCSINYRSLQTIHLSKKAVEDVKMFYGRDTILHIAVHEGHILTAEFVIEKLLYYPEKLQELLLITGKYGGIFDEIVHNPIRMTKANPNMLIPLFKKLSGHYDILEKVITRLAETNGLILVQRQTSFTLLEKLVACKNLKLFQIVIESVKENPLTLRKILLTNRNGLINLAVRCLSKTQDLFPKFLKILHQTILDEALCQELLLERDDDKYTVLHLLANRSSNSLLLKPLLDWLQILENDYPGIVANLVQAKDKQKLTPLEVAIYREHTDTMIALLEFIKKVFGTIFDELISTHYDSNILFKAVAQGRDTSTKLLLRWFYENVESSTFKNVLFITTNDGRTCLHLASARGFHTTCEVVLNFLKQINNTMSFGNILYEMLLKKHVDGRTSFNEALRWKSSFVVALYLRFIDNNIDTNVIKELINNKERFGDTCIKVTAASGSPNDLQLILEYILKKFGRDFLETLILTGDDYGNTAAHECSNVLLDFIHQKMDLSALKNLIFRGNKIGTTLLDIVMYPETKNDIFINVREKIGHIVDEISNPKEPSISFSKADLTKLKTFIEKHFDREDNDNIIGIIDKKITTFTEASPGELLNDINQPSTNSGNLLLLPE